MEKDRGRIRDVERAGAKTRQQGEGFDGCPSVGSRERWKDLWGIHTTSDPGGRVPFPNRIRNVVAGGHSSPDTACGDHTVSRQIHNQGRWRLIIFGNNLSPSKVANSRPASEAPVPVSRTPTPPAAAEMRVSNKNKSFTRATVEMAFEGTDGQNWNVAGPETLDVSGASDLFPIFQTVGNCSAVNVIKLRGKILRLRLRLRSE